jgi:hypothetical protein
VMDVTRYGLIFLPFAPLIALIDHVILPAKYTKRPSVTYADEDH